ncbi:MAG: hypothetical protein GXO75_19015 [Calditrichaeota bacterium]|nr:hypothetical protein [Calditrichota bacterium]
MNTATKRLWAELLLRQTKEWQLFEKATAQMNGFTMRLKRQGIEPGNDESWQQWYRRFVKKVEKPLEEKWREILKTMEK